MSHEPVSLVHRAVAGVPLSGRERSLIQFARNKFGGDLTRFLLSGLGEEAEARRWLFIITFTGGSGIDVNRRVYVEPDDLRPEIETSLPRRREPLVILALMKLLMRGRTSSARLLYGQEEVLSILGWKDDEQARLVIDETPGRYFRLNYHWGLSRKELADRKLCSYRTQDRFISGHGYREAEGNEGRMIRTANYVEFNDLFVEELSNGSLFGVDWNQIRAFRRKVAGR